MIPHNADAPLVEIPLFLSPAVCGFPSPAQDYVEQTIDLNQLCVSHPAATYYVRAKGNSMLGAGIHDGDLLIVDRSMRAVHGAVVIASVDGEFTVKRLQLLPQPALLPENDDYPPILLDDGSNAEMFGVVAFVVHSLKVTR
ncbi:translesion error-prone DNA polymerase V autoproteolytic subunit [Aeromonas caviae]|uniref:translesion error-prone DNA polymerase V autoproteolytic subunit n=2 Tax=Aeromonadaceae TaxID=84642 RepID=UPI001C22BCC9|nr:translesion error-prone DNA polymerase V autoproteolytic subunit [Aeromonas veronii]QXC01375.1 translesion error-prone DNA polymerase V autoproteolytic subunit [Aeromonas sp. FDAARGOS 1418]GKR06567.1 protein impA' [Aeromonas caviae]